MNLGVLYIPGNIIPSLMIPGVPISPEFSKTLTSACAALCFSWLFMCILKSYYVIIIFKIHIVKFYLVWEPEAFYNLTFSLNRQWALHFKGSLPFIHQGKMTKVQGNFQSWGSHKLIDWSVEVAKNLRPFSADIGRATQIPWYFWFQRCVKPKTNSPARLVELWVAFPKAGFLPLAVSLHSCMYKNTHIPKLWLFLQKKQ